MRKIVLSEIGGYDERMGAGTKFAAEDIDLAAAALWSGVMGVYDPRPVVYHHHGRKTQAESAKLLTFYGAGRGAYYAKYVLKRESSRTYLRAWMRSAGYDCVTSARHGRLPRRSLREVYDAMRFVLGQVFARLDAKRRL
jgi:hypothetical protein